LRCNAEDNEGGNELTDDIAKSLLIPGGDSRILDIKIKIDLIKGIFEELLQMIPVENQELKNKFYKMRNRTYEFEEYFKQCLEKK
jgi:hypothetical protein